MAMPGLLSDYIIKNYKRLLVCVVPPADVDEHTPSPTTPSDSSFVVPPSPRAHSLDTPTSSPRAPLESSVPRWRRRRSTTRVRARRSAGPYVYVHEGDQLVREDPFRGCVSSRSVGPRSSGDFVVMGCMQV